MVQSNAGLAATDLDVWDVFKIQWIPFPALCSRETLQPKRSSSCRLPPAWQAEGPEAHQQPSAGFQPNCNHKKVSSSTELCSIYRRWITLQSLRPATVWFLLFL